MLVSWMKRCCQLLLLCLSWGSADTSSEGAGSPQTPGGPVSPLPSEVKSVLFQGGRQVEEVQVLDPMNLVLECTWTGSQNKPPNISGFWRKDGFELPGSRLAVPLENQQYNLKREFHIANEESLGNYSCVFNEEAEVQFVLAAPQIGEMKDKRIVSYVGDSVVLECKMKDPKLTPNTWFWFRANRTEKERIDAQPDSPRYHVQNLEGKSRLTVRNLTEEDAGLYHCTASFNISDPVGRVQLRVITLMEPLKPFLVIVAEVVLLVSVILLYERSKARRSQRTENESSDDQGNTMTQEDGCGVDTESTTRQRRV